MFFLYIIQLNDVELVISDHFCQLLAFSIIAPSPPHFWHQPELRPPGFVAQPELLFMIRCEVLQAFCAHDEGCCRLCSTASNIASFRRPCSTAALWWHVPVHCCRDGYTTQLQCYATTMSHLDACAWNNCRGWIRNRSAVALFDFSTPSFRKNGEVLRLGRL